MSGLHEPNDTISISCFLQVVSWWRMQLDRRHSPRELPPQREVKKRLDWSFFKRFEFTPAESEARRPRALDFEHASLDDRVNADKYLLRLKHRQSKHPEIKSDPEEPLGSTFEEFLVEAMRDGDWFGGKFFRTTEHDDRWNGVDAVIEWPSPTAEGRPVRMAIDFSTSRNNGILHEKLQTINGMAKVKYFRSQIEHDENGKPLEVRAFFPKVILGADVDMMKQVAREGVMPGRDHPLRVLMLRQAKRQIDVQIRCAADHYLDMFWGEADLGPEAGEVCRQIRVASNPDAVVEALRNAPASAFARLFTKTQKETLDSCLRVQACLDPMIEETKSVQIPEPWNTMSQVSVNHQALSKVMPDTIRQR